MERNVYTAWNQKNEEYGLVIAESKFLFHIYRKDCYLQNLEEPLPRPAPSEEEKQVYFLSFRDSMDRISAIPIEAQKMLQRTTMVSWQDLVNSQQNHKSNYFVATFREEKEEVIGIVFMDCSSLGDVLFKTSFYAELPVSFLFIVFEQKNYYCLFVWIE